MSTSANARTGALAAGSVVFELDGREVAAASGESLWQVARREGVTIPHLCHSAGPGYRPDGNCRACMVEIAGERVLAASCIRQPTPGMKVTTSSQRALEARRLVMELLLADQPERPIAPDPNSKLWRWADRMEVSGSRFPRRSQTHAIDQSHPAMSVQLDACIHCGLCVRACREVQVNDVIGMARRGHHAQIVFDFADPMGESTCVGCGECVQACPTGALLPSSTLDADGRKSVRQATTVDSLCPYCGVGCQAVYHVSDNRVVMTEGRDGPANQNRLCVKGRFGFDYVHHPHRLTTPWIRLPGAPRGADVEVDPSRPQSHFRPASWDEALNVAAQGFLRVLERSGPDALAGFGSAKGSNEEAYLFQKLVRAGFGSNHVDHCTRLCHASSVAALLEGIGSGAVTAPVSECLNSQVIFVIGANPTVNHPVAATFLKNAVKKGAALIVADPRGQALSRLATFDLRFRPGSDVALLNALIHVIITEKLYNEEYLAKHTAGFELLRERTSAFAPEAMAPICGIEPEVLRSVARTYAKARGAMIFWGMGISQHVHGTDNARCLIALALLTGNVGKPGSGLHPLRGQNNVQGASDAGLIPMVFPDYRPVGDPRVRDFYQQLWGVTLDPTPGLTVVEIMKAIHAGRIQGMYILGENPAMSDPDLHHARAALAKLEHLVVQEIFLTETAYHADVILPATAFLEKTGSFTNTDRRVQLGRQALEPPGQARPDWWIIQEIARRMGLDWNYSHPRDIFNEMRRGMESLRGITWERLEREGAVTYPCDDERHGGHEVLFGDGFPTPSRKARIVPAAIVPPDEQPDSEYPIILTTGRVLEHWHTGAMTRRASVLDEIEPEPMVHIHPRSLRQIQAQAGHFLQVSTRRGSIQIKARADVNVPEGVIFIPFCYAEAAANLLTNSALDPVGKIPEFKFCAAKIAPV